MHTKPAMASSTFLACCGAGSLKLGTPLETASTPVSAVQPEAKALRIRITIASVASSAEFAAMTASSGGVTMPRLYLTMPVTIRESIVRMNR